MNGCACAAGSRAQDDIGKLTVKRATGYYGDHLGRSRLGSVSAGYGDSDGPGKRTVRGRYAEHGIGPSLERHDALARSGVHLGGAQLGWLAWCLLELSLDSEGVATVETETSARN